MPAVIETQSPETRKFEHLITRIHASSEAASYYVAEILAKELRAKQKAGENLVLGLATGSTPVRVYEILVQMHREDGLSFQNLVTFNLDEYYPMEPDSIHSYVRFMKEHLFDHIDIKPGNVHIPDGTLEENAIEAYCRDYERQIEKAGGIDIQLLGIGRTGHIGFNEPGSGARSGTRLVRLDRLTRQDAASDFFGLEHVPHRALTMGVGNILAAKRVLLMAWGEGKASIVQRTVEGDISESVPATFLQQHPNCEIILDKAAASLLTREKTPWLVGECQWDEDLIRKAVIWLSIERKKALLKLTNEDYNEHGMGALVAGSGSAEEINLSVFKSLQDRITGWPGGKPETDDQRRPERSTPFPKRCLIFSPHPDDDVISMGATLLRLVEQGHEVHVAYQTSGNIAVFDDEVIRFLDFVKEVHPSAAETQERVIDFLKNKKAGEVDSSEVQQFKALIRKGEALSACRYCGIPEEQAHFMNLPFYETGRVRKKPASAEDRKLTKELLNRVQPHQIYAAGDLSDPHGTHRVCLNVILDSLAELADEGHPWMQDCRLWLYRGAWQEWDLSEMDMIIPFGPRDQAKKRNAIFRHQSQKDKAMFPGHDDREFWQRAEERNQHTALQIDLLGLAEYEAVEGFVRHPMP